MKETLLENGHLREQLQMMGEQLMEVSAGWKHCTNLPKHAALRQDTAQPEHWLYCTTSNCYIS